MSEPKQAWPKEPIDAIRKSEPIEKYGPNFTWWAITDADGKLLANCWAAQTAQAIIDRYNACAGMESPAKEIAELRACAAQVPEATVLLNERLATLAAKDARIAELEDHLGTLVDACNMASHGCPVCGNTSAEEDCTETCGLVQAQLALEAK